MLRMRIDPTHGAMIVLAAASLGGCVVGPDFHAPEAPKASRYTESPLPAQTASSPGAGGAAQHFVAGAALPEQWWALYRSEPLDRLIRQGIAESPSLAAARATLQQARENLAAEFGALAYPAVDANLSAQREKISNAAFGGQGVSLFSLYGASVNVSYGLDFFGGSRRALEGLRAQVDYQRYQLDAAHLALTANIVTTAIREASLRAQIQASRDMLKAEEDEVSRVARQYELGGVGRLELISQRAQAAQTEATLPPLENQLAATRHALAALTGRTPEEAALPAFELDSLQLPEQIPVSVSSDLVRQRPDIQAAEALLHQASAQIGVATAALYPHVTLDGNFGSQSTHAHDLFGGQTVWGIGASLAQPIFHGGELRAERRAAVAAYDAAQAQYRETVLEAFRNVADALRALETDARAVQAQTQAEALARDRVELTRTQYRLGGTSYIALLDAQRQYFAARLLLVVARASRYADTAALFQALGGGWREGHD